MKAGDRGWYNGREVVVKAVIGYWMWVTYELISPDTGSGWITNHTNVVPMTFKVGQFYYFKNATIITTYYEVVALKDDIAAVWVYYTSHGLSHAGWLDLRKRKDYEIYTERAEIYDHSL